MQKIKSFLESDKGKDILTIIIVILVGLGSFGLGRLSKNAQNEGIKVEYVGQGIEGEASAISALNEAKGEITGNEGNSAKNFFASSRGQKYYSIGCTGGKTLKEENKVWFSSKEEAERAGYELSSTCR